MRLREFILIFLIISTASFGQEFSMDTISPGDPLPKGDYIYKTVVDTAITIVINELMAKNDGLILDEAGEDDDWFEIYNYGDSPILLSNLWLSDDPAEPFKWKVPSKNYIAPDEYILFWADGETEQGEMHTSFKLSGDGEYLGITYKDSSLIDHCLFSSQTTNISFGRFPNGGLSWYFFNDPSPGEMNTNIGGFDILPLPEINTIGGIFHNSFPLSLSTIISGSEIRYTTDCSDPTIESSLYSDPFTISETTILKARIFKEGALEGPVLTRSYLFLSYGFDNPVLSLVANPEDFFGSKGLITNNVGNIEVPANMEFIVDGQSKFSSGTGVQLHSVKSYKPTSMRLYARSRYGESWFTHPFFDKQGPQKFKRLVLRNSGNDNVNKASSNTHFRDPLIHEIAETSTRNPWVSQSRPLNIFLNGEYYALVNMRERIDEYYIESHTGIDEDIHLLERAFDYPFNRNAICGSFTPFDSMVYMIDTLLDISSQEGLDFVEENIDIDNFTDYWITEVFVGNFDWLSNNIKLWKPVEGGKWKWIYWDTDHGIGLNYGSYGNTSWNTLAWSLSFSSRTWEGKNNRIIRNLLMNHSYKEHFIKRFSILLNTSFSPAQTIPILDSVSALYKNDMSIHANQWNREMSNWISACDNIETYLKDRPDYQMSHLQDFFGLENPVDVHINILPENSGIVEIEGHLTKTDDFTARLFPNIPYKIKVKPRPGFTVDHWSIDGIIGDSTSIDFSEIGDITIYCTPVSLDTLLYISEIYYNNKDSYDSEDWMEFYYNGISSLDMSGFYITNEANEKVCIFDQGAEIYPNSFFTVCENPEEFSKIFPPYFNQFGTINSPIPANEKLSLFTKSNILILSFTFMDNDINWPKISTQGYSIEKINLENSASSGVNWTISKNEFGTPGLPFGSQYNFQAPEGRNAEYKNSEIIHVKLLSDQSFYNDPDGHDLAGIYIKSIRGPGILFHGSTAMTAGTCYSPKDLLFTPEGAQEDSTFLSYNFIDYSGEFSKDYEIVFRAPNAIETAKKNKLSVYPNPTSNYCNITFPKEIGAELELRITDLRGAVVYRESLFIAEQEIRIDLSLFKKGIYFIQLNGGNSIYSGKIVLQ